MPNGAKTLVLIDGHALAYRCFFAYERTGMKTSDNQPTWAVFGFFKALFDLLKKYNFDAIATTFDVGRQTFRTEQYPEYKANRESMPDTMRSQIGLILEGLEALNIPIYTKENYEADDVIGSIAKQAKALGHKTVVLTGDQDSFQLVDREGFVKILIPSKGELIEYDWYKVYEKLGVYPFQVVDYKGLRGDTSDNIPGIKGIGEKTAQKLLHRFENLEDILAHTDEIKEKALKEKLISGKEIAILSKELATICTNLDVGFDFDKTNLEIKDINTVVDYLKKMQFYSFIREIESILSPFTVGQAQSVASVNEESVVEQSILQTTQANGQLQLGFDFSAFNMNETSAINKKEFERIIVDTEEKFTNLLDELNKQTVFSIDTETTSLDIMETELVGISLAYNPQIQAKNNRIFVDKEQEDVTKSYYIPVFHLVGEQLEMDYVLENIKPVLENENIAKVAQNAKYDINVLKRYDINLNNVIFDTMLASYVYNPSRKHGLKVQAAENLDFIMTEYEDLVGTGKKALSIEQVEIEEAGKYACDDAFATLELARYWHEKLSDEELKLVYDIETPLTYVLADMERTGVFIDVNYLQTLADKINAQIDEVSQKIYAEAGCEFNINSPAQVADILFNKLELKPKGRKIKPSTNAKVLESLAEEHKIAGYILENRHLAKLKSTYVENLPNLVSIDDRIHTSYNQTVTVTGRLSSSNPNLQNIPIRTKLGNEIRAAFIAQNQDYSIMSADYSQIELRLLAHCSDDEVLISAFNNDEDIHAQTASKIFGVGLNEVTKEMRMKAKAVNFGLIYGQTRYGLASALSITADEAQSFIDKYFEAYPKVREYMDKSVREAYQHGYSKTLYGRKRYLMDELLSSNHAIKEFAQRSAINTPLQGTAADLIKLAMIRLAKALSDNNLETKIIMQVHDELVLEVKNSEIEIVKKLVQQAMELEQPFKVSLVLDMQISESWQEK